MASSGRDGLAYSGYRTPIEGVPDREITQTGRGTPGGEYLRRFWQPVAYLREIEDRPLRVRVLGEDLVAFRDRGGAVGVLHLHCCHRGTSLEYGRVEAHGIRCCYHGRVFDVDGTILEMPGEPAAERLRKEFKQGAYPAHVFAGIVFAYMGPIELKPPFPRYDKFEVPGMKLAPGPRLPFACNWVQVKENSMDPAHTAILHAWEGMFASEFGKFPQITWSETPSGMLYAASRRVEDKIWVRSTDIMMPNIHSITSVFEDGRSLKDCAPPWITMWTVPEDDHSSQQFVVVHMALDDPTPLEVQHRVMDIGQTPNRPYAERQRVPGDYDAMTSQGSIAPHSLEALGTLDQGVVMFRQLLRKGIRAVQAGNDPPCLMRGNEVLPTFASDLVVPVSAMAGNPDDPDALMAFARQTARDYLKAPPLGHRRMSKPVPLPARAVAA
ncbi:MAG TPA: aromatic ring-hydroxylating dioxygenase subunit alpha [Stellaceae bacterium]|nr:aromatic ring-hydroxylating dioxygenase subunit alpha [Stellaceae bacterium]